MNIYHIEFAKTGTNLSGGEVCMLELIKRFSEWGHKNILLTTDNGEATYRKNLPVDAVESYITIKAYEVEKKYGAFISYVHRTFLAAKLIKRLKNLPNDSLVICHSDFFPNSIANRVFLNKFSKVKSAAFFHMKAPGIFRGYKGEYTGKHQFPKPAGVHYTLNQLLYRKLMKPKTVIFTVNGYYKLYLNKIYAKNKVVVLTSYGGPETFKHSKTKKVYDLIWVGRFHAQKGLPEFIKIVNTVKLDVPSVRAVILGEGDASISQNAHRLVEKYGLQENIKFAGFVTGTEKYNYYECSKIFVITSTYESFGQVILEAMALGLPVVAYDLPVYEVFKKGIIHSPLMDVSAASKQIGKLLSNQDYYLQISNNAKNESMTHSWEETANTIIEMFEDAK